MVHMELVVSLWEPGQEAVGCTCFYFLLSSQSKPRVSAMSVPCKVKLLGRGWLVLTHSVPERVKKTHCILRGIKLMNA